MTSELKCPYCNKPLQPTLRNSYEYWCENYDCPVASIELVGSQKLWRELIKVTEENERTRKALAKAKNGLKELKDIIACPPDISYEIGVSMYADGVLQEITALEQKDK